MLKITTMPLSTNTVLQNDTNIDKHLLDLNIILKTACACQSKNQQNNIITTERLNAQTEESIHNVYKRE